MFPIYTLYIWLIVPCILKAKYSEEMLVNFWFSISWLFFFSFYVEWICLFSLIYISLEILRKSSRNRNSLQMCVCMCVCVCVYHILKISVSEIQNGGWDFNVWKRREKLKLEKPFCLSYCIEEITFIIMLLTNMMNILMLFQTVWEVFDEKGINYI